MMPMVTTPRPKGVTRRRTIVVTAVAALFVVSMAVVWAATTSGSSHGSETTQSATTDSTSTATAATAKASAPGRRSAIVVLGDSTTQYGGYAQGWEVLLHEAYVRMMDTVNRGLSGYNTRLFLQYAMPGINEELQNYYKAAVVVIWFGVNDATLDDGPNYKQHVPVDEYKKNLIEMIKQIRASSPATKVLLISPNYVDEKQRLASMLKQGRKEGDPLDRNNKETLKYATACGEVMKEINDDHVAYIDAYNYFSTNYPSDSDRAKVLRDGLHFTPDGDRIFFQLVNDKIETMVPTGLLTNPQFPYDTAIM